MASLCPKFLPLLKPNIMINFIKVQRIRLEITYRIIMKRIAKGYTEEQLSLLLCRPADYISSLELLQIPLPTKDELQEIAWVLGEQDITSFFPRIHQSVLLNVLLEKQNFGYTRIHTCDIITQDEKEIPFFFLQEEIEDSVPGNNLVA